ncbi:hypothetical protein U1Q18_000905 [Sarracenia purpurea var. burkii]
MPEKGGGGPVGVSTGNPLPSATHTARERKSFEPRTKRSEGVLFSCHRRPILLPACSFVASQREKMVDFRNSRDGSEPKTGKGGAGLKIAGTGGVPLAAGLVPCCR